MRKKTQELSTETPAPHKHVHKGLFLKTDFYLLIGQLPPVEKENNMDHWLHNLSTRGIHIYPENPFVFSAS
jgi:hypothetical protein